MHNVEIWIEGTLNQQWLEWLGDFDLSYSEQNDSILSGQISDQAALYGLIGKMRDLGITILKIDYGNRAELA